MSKYLNLGCLVLGFFGLLGTAAIAQEIPPYTSVVISVEEPIDSRTADANRHYRAVLDEDLVVNGQALARKGDDALLRVVQVEQAGAVSGRAALTLQLAAVSIGGQMRPVTSVEVKTASGSQGAKAARTGITGAAIGAGVGALLGGGGGAAKGAAIGATGGVTVAALTGQRVQVSKEARLSFMTGAPASAGVPAVADSAPAVAGGGGAITVVDAQRVRFEFVEAKADGDTLTISMWATNNGVDRGLEWQRGNETTPTAIVDDTGSSYQVREFLVGNQQVAAPLVNGVRTPLTLTFKGLATIGGRTQASEIRRLTVGFFLTQTSQPRVRFDIQMRNISIQKLDSATPAVAVSVPEPRPAIPLVPAVSQVATTVVDSNQIRFEFVEARADGDTLTISMWATNNGVDRGLEWQRGNETTPTAIVDDTGSSYQVREFLVGNQKVAAPLVNGVRTPLTLTFKGLATIGGRTQAGEIKRLTVGFFLTQTSQPRVRFEIQMRDLAIQK